MKGVFTRKLTQQDIVQLDQWRRQYVLGDLELPKDFQSDGVYSVGSQKDFKLISSLTGVQSVILDPFIKNPDASPTDLLFSLIKMETVLTHWAMERGCVDAYIAVPKAEEKYAKLLSNYGFEPTVQGCVVMRRPLKPDFIPLIGPERDRAEVEANAPTK